MLRARSIPQPIDVIRVLSRHGLSLKKAGNVVDRLASSDLRPVPVGLRTDNPRRVIDEPARLGVSARQIKVPRVEPQKVRADQHLSQQEFAMLYGLELDTLQNWEQDRYAPDRATQVLLKLIERHPDLVVQVLTDDGSV